MMKSHKGKMPHDEDTMPSVSEKQRRFMGMELAKKRKGKKTKTGMNESQLRDFAGKVKAKKSILGFKSKAY